MLTICIVCMYVFMFVNNYYFFIFITYIKVTEIICLSKLNELSQT